VFETEYYEGDEVDKREQPQSGELNQELPLLIATTYAALHVVFHAPRNLLVLESECNRSAPNNELGEPCADPNADRAVSNAQDLSERGRPVLLHN
jgi:hypothetical protein